MQYDLEDRTIKFSFSVIDFTRTLEINVVNSVIISQLIRSATSVGANYREANAAISKKEFKSKIYICRKEIQETKYWIELMAHSNHTQKEPLRILWQEAHELTLIFSKIASSLKA
jgi:four helix bundle protein